MVTKCTVCTAEYVKARNEAKTDETGIPVELPFIEDSITWVPVWQQQSILGQVMMACISLPVCLNHIEVKEKTPEQRAVEGGIVLGRGNG